MSQSEKYSTPPSKITNNYKLKYKQSKNKNIQIDENCIKMLKFKECNGYDFVKRSLVNDVYKNTLKKCNENCDDKYCDKHLKKYKNITDKDECVICYEKILLNEEVPLECGHIFHVNCLKMCKTLKCPLCRCNFNNKDITVLYNLVRVTMANESGKFDLDVPYHLCEEYGNTFIELLYIEVKKIIESYKGSVDFKTDIVLLNKIFYNILTNDICLDVYRNVYNEVFKIVIENGITVFKIKDDICLDVEYDDTDHVNEEKTDPRYYNYLYFVHTVEELFEKLYTV